MMQLEAVTTLIHRAALEPELWLTALGALADATKSYRGQLIGVGGPHTVPFNWVTHLDDAMSQRFVEIGGGDPTVNFRIASSGKVGMLVDERAYAPFRTQIGDNIYEDFCREADMPFGCQTIITQGDEKMIGLALLRARRDGRTTAQQRDFFANVIPHVTAAVKLQMAIEHRGSLLVQGALGAINAPALLIDAFGRIAAVTPAGDAALTFLPHLDVQGSELVCAAPRNQTMLDDAVGRVLRGVALNADLLLSGGTDPPLRLSVHRLEASEWSLGFVPCAILVLHMPAQSNGTTATLLRTTYLLTAAESEIALLLGRGVARDEIARLRGASIGTVRQQIKTIFAKLEINREGQLRGLFDAIGA